MTKPRSPAESVAVVLAIGIVVALNCIALGAVYAVVFRTGVTGLGENTTQVLTGWGGGIVGVLGAYVGYTFGKRQEPPD